MVRILRFVVHPLLRLDPDAILRTLVGAFTAGLVVGVLDAFFATFGHSLEATAACLVVCGIAASLLVDWPWFEESSERTRRRIATAAAVLVAVLGISAPTLFAAASRLLAVLPLPTIDNVGVRAAVFLAIGAGVLGPVFGGTIVGCLKPLRPGESQPSLAGLLGIAGGGLLVVLVAAPLVSATTMTWGSACGVLITAGLVLLRHGATDVRTPPIEHCDPPNPSELVWRSASVAALGAFVACTSRLVFEFFFASTALLHVAWLSVLLGLWFAPRRLALRTGELGALPAAIWAVGLVTAQGPLVDLALAAIVHAESAWSQTFVRVGFVLATMLPFGVAWSLLDGGERRTNWPPSPLALGVGFVVGTSLASVFGEAVVTAGFAVAVGSIVAVRRLATWRRPRPTWQRAATVLAVAALVSSPWLTSGYRPERPSKLLFSTHVTVAVRNGADARYHESLDGSRLVAIRPGPYGTHTIWRHFGLQHELRTSGNPTGVVSHSPGICPQVPVETMVAALPLVLHDAPRDVLFLGVADGVAVDTALGFPVRTLTCTEGDRSRVAVLREVVHAAGGRSPLEDDRVSLLGLEPVVAVSAIVDRFDVVVSDPPHAGLARIAPLFEEPFLSRCRARLADGGIFCQRLRSVDLGPEVVLDLVRRFRDVFEETRVVACGAGELLLMGAPRGGLALPSDLAARLRAPHVRHALTEAGWDWSTPLSLATFDDDALALLEERFSPSAGQLSYRVPLETVRWGLKMQSLTEALVEVATRPLDRLPLEDVLVVDARARLAETEEAFEIQRGNPDEWWMYRGRLKRKLAGGARAIQTVSGAPAKIQRVDRRRLDYLVALGEAVGERPPSPGAIARLLDFANERDPLVEYFARAEASRLYARCPERRPADELEQRLWLLFHADSQDRSVRNAAAAIQLVADHPSAVPDPADRWDVVNGLLQVLVDRWETRARFEPLSPKKVLGDIAATLGSHRSAVRELTSLSEAGVVGAETCRLRIEHLDEQLVQPLKSYRERLRAHESERKARVRRLAESDDD